MASRSIDPPKTTPSGTQRAPAERPREDEGGDLEHIRETGLPPGIDVEEAKDPGSQAPRKPVLNRS